MISQDLHREKKQKHMPVWLLVIMDVVLIGLSLCVFALFHHVMPRQDDVDLSKIPGSTTPPAGYVTAGPAATDDQGNTVNPSGWGVKFADKFTDGEVIQTDTTYQSENINVTVTKVQEDGVTYFVQDIYIRKIECFRTAFAGDKYGRGMRDSVLNMAMDNEAICAMNGDYYGSNPDVGVVIRNGYPYQDNPDGDVCVLFYNGEMKTYSQQEFDSDTVVAQGAYQAWCFGPTLVENGKAITETDSAVWKENPRSGIGYYEPGHYCFVTVDGRQEGYSKGLELLDYAKLFEELGCVTAYNLDGGRTSVMTFGDKVINQPVEGGRTSSDILLIREWEE